MPATSAAHNSLLFFLFLLRPFTVLMKQTRQAVRVIKQSIFRLSISMGVKYFEHELYRQISLKILAEILFILHE